MIERSDSITRGGGILRLNGQSHLVEKAEGDPEHDERHAEPSACRTNREINNERQTGKKAVVALLVRPDISAMDD